VVCSTTNKLQLTRNARKQHTTKQMEFYNFWRKKKRCTQPTKKDKKKTKQKKESSSNNKKPTSKHEVTQHTQSTAKPFTNKITKKKKKPKITQTPKLLWLMQAMVHALHFQQRICLHFSPVDIIVHQPWPHSPSAKQTSCLCRRKKGKGEEQQVFRQRTRGRRPTTC